MLTYDIAAGAGTARHTDWNRALREVYGPGWSLHPYRPLDFRISIQAVQMGSLILSRASLAQAQVTTRGHQLGGRGNRAYNLYVANRSQHLLIGGRAVVLEPSDFTIADSAVTSTITTDQPYTAIGLTIPASALQNYVPRPERAIGMRFSGTEGLSSVVSLMLRDLWDLAARGRVEHFGSRLITSLLEAVSACCDLAHSAAPVPYTNAVARREQICEGLDRHLRDSAFAVALLGRELGLSPRYIRMLFNDGGETISQYMRKQRLAGCRRDLADPAWRDHSIAAIAFRWGFKSTAHFSRVFRAKFGTSPGRFREERLSALQRSATRALLLGL